MTDPFPPSDAFSRLLDEFATNSEATKPDLVIRTGFRDFDESLHGGLRTGQVTLIAGVAGVGTSTFALGLARNAALRNDLKTLFVAPDSSEREILVRMLAAEAKVPVSRLRWGDLDGDDQGKVLAHRDALATAPILISAGWRVSGTTETLLDSVRGWMRQGVRFVVVDGTSGAEPCTRDLIKGLKLLTLSHSAAVVVVSKSVVPEARRRERAVLEDLREYTEVADLIDLAVMLHRDDLHDENSTRAGEADLEIIKHRYGPLRRTTLMFQGHYARFVDAVP